ARRAAPRAAHRSAAAPRLGRAGDELPRPGDDQALDGAGAQAALRPAMSAPRVSVILPTYNRAHLLPRAIASVLGQSYRDFELIVVDDGSKDHTVELMRGYD